MNLDKFHFIKNDLCRRVWRWEKIVLDNAVKKTKNALVPPKEQMKGGGNILPRELPWDHLRNTKWQKTKNALVPPKEQTRGGREYFAAEMG